MSLQSFTTEQLHQAAQEGEKEASKALSTLAGQDVSVGTKQAGMVKGSDIQSSLEAVAEHSVVAYTQAIEGLTGVSILVLEREEALTLVDLFNKRPQGTTKVMQELDRSTIKETLNILANSYIRGLANSAQITIKLDVPHIVTKDRIQELQTSVSDGGKDGLLFNTNMSVSQADFNIKLLFFFLTNAS